MQLLIDMSRWLEFHLKQVSDLVARLAQVEPSWLDALEDWQTLIAGAIAFVPAFFAAVFVWRQVNDQREQFHRTTDAAAVKARLRLSRNISHVSRHLDSCFDYLIAGDLDYKKHALPDELLDDILEAAVTAKTSNLKFFQSYIEKLQSYASNCDLYANLKGEARLVLCFRYLGELDALTDLLYPYSRFEVDAIAEAPISLDEVKQRLMHNLKRGKDITGSNLMALVDLGRFDS